MEEQLVVQQLSKKEEKRLQQEEKRLQQEEKRMERIRVIPPFHPWKPSDIECFYTTPITKKRGLIMIDLLHMLPFTHDTTYGHIWRVVYESLHHSIRCIAEQTQVGNYNQVRMLHQRGKPALDLFFLQDDVLVTKRIISYELSISNISPLVSFPVATVNGWIEPYDSFYYHHYLDHYLEIDEGITVAKPSLHDFCTLIRKYTNDHPFSTQVRERATEKYLDKKRVLHASIYEYLHHYASSCQASLFATQFLETQRDTVYLVWNTSTDQFDMEYITFSPEEFHFSHIQHRNTIVFHTERFSISFYLHWFSMSCPLEPTWDVTVKKRKVV